MNSNITPPKLSLADTTPVHCEKCNSETFLPAIRFREVSSILTGSHKPQLIPIEIYVCSNCGAILEKLLPNELKTKPKLDLSKVNIES